MKSPCRKQRKRKIIFPFSIFNARKIIFTIIAAFSTIKTVLFMLERDRSDGPGIERVENLFDFSREKFHWAFEKWRNHQIVGFSTSRKALKHPEMAIFTPFLDSAKVNEENH